MIAFNVNKIDWGFIEESLNQKGYAIIPDFLSDQMCKDFILNYDNQAFYRKTVVMERYRFGLGEYKYFKYPLPKDIEDIRQLVYPKLAPVANRWMNALRIDKSFPTTFEGLQSKCHKNEQLLPTPLILKYKKGGFNTLHQDMYGEVYFPMQCVLFLNEPDKDFSGGEFVLTEQTPRAQSRAIVLKPKKRDMLIFTTNFRPKKGVRGYHRVIMKHGVSEVEKGIRHTLGIIFHDALT